jgi:MFS superfamily sulfate permease-like transporter
MLLSFLTLNSLFLQTIPASVAAVLVSTILEYVLVRPLGYETYTINDFAPIQQNRALLPIWVKSIDNDDSGGGGYDTTLPTVDTKLLGEIFLTAFFTAFIGLFESLLTMQIIDELTESKGSANREACGQGLGQICCGIFGGMGGCTTIGQSLMNMHSGGYTRLSSSVAGVVLLFITVIAYPLINVVPVASLAGVMFLVSFFT